MAERKRITRLVPIIVVAVALAVGYWIGQVRDDGLGAQDVSPTRAMDRDYYVPNSEDLARDEMATLVVQVNGKLRERITVPPSITEDEARQLVMESEKVMAHLEGKQLVKVIYVPGRLVNLVVR